MNKPQAFVCLVVLLIQVWSIEANGHKMPGGQANRGKFTLSGSIFGKRACFGAGENNLNTGTTAADSDAAEESTPTSTDTWCEKAYHSQMAYMWTTSPNIWLYNMRKLMAVCKY